MHYSNLFLYTILIAINHYDPCCNSPSTKATTCAGSETTVASQTGLHSSHHWTYSASHTNPFIAPLCGPTSFGSLAQTSCPRTTRNDGIMEVQTMLEGSQRKAFPLSALWRSLEQDTISDLCTTRAGIVAQTEEPWAITACDKCVVHRMGLGWIRRSPWPWTKWLRKTCGTRQREAQTEEQEQGATICRFSNATAVETRRGVDERHHIDFLSACHSSGGDGERNQSSLHRRKGYASQCTACCGEARPQQRPTAHGIHEQGHQRPREGSRQFEEIVRSENKTPRQMDGSYEKSDGDSLQAGRCLRGATEGLQQQDQIHPEGHSGDSPRATEAHSSSCSRPYSRSCRTSSGGGRALRQCSRCRGRCTTHAGPRFACQMLEEGRQGHCGGDCLRRREHGHWRRKSQQASKIVGSIWLFYQVTLGNGGDCPHGKDHRVPLSITAKDAGIPVEAYDHLYDGCAASWDSSYTPWPLHPRAYNDDVCVFPFMAIHNAHVLAYQCGNLDDEPVQHADADSWISCFEPLPAWVPPRDPFKAAKTVNFSSDVDVHYIYEDEIGTNFSQSLLPTTWMQPKQHHLTDNHMRSAQDRYRDEFYPRRPPDAQAHALANQPEFVQDLAVTLHHEGTFDPRTQERYIKVLTWYLHGIDRRECRLARIVRLTEDFLTWSQILTDAWHGTIRPQQAVSFYVVEPEPPIAEWEDHHAQLILVQAPQHFERAVLFSSVYHAHQQVAFQRIARFCLSELHLQECIDNAEVPRQVRHRPIQAFYGWRPILPPPQPRTAVVDGAAVVLHVRQAPETLGQFERYPFDFLWQEDEYVPQHTSHRTRSRSPRRHDSASDDEVSCLAHQPIPTRPEPALVDFPEVAREAHMLTEDEAEETDSSASASTYDSDEPSSFFNIFQLKSPMYAARVRTDSWPLTYSQVRHVIGLARHEIQYIYMVNYRPADLYAAGTLVALVLRANDLDTGDTRRMVLVDIVFQEHNAADTTTHRYATLVRKDMTRRLLLEDLKLQAYCKQVKQQCIVRINGKLLPLSNHILFDMHHADYIRIDLPPHAKRSLPSKAIARCLRDGLSLAEAQRLFDEADTDFEWETVSTHPLEGSDEVELLQRHMTRRQTAELVAHTQRPESMPVPICLDELIPAPPQTCIDFAAVQWTAIELASIDLDLLQGWPDDLELENVTFDHLALLGPLSQQPPRAIHLYVDGSKNGGNVGAGVACFFEYTTHEALAGCMSKSVQPAQHAFVGEHAAMTWALIWAIHISDWCLSSFATTDIDISFNFDAMNTGYQAAGHWRTVEHRAWKTVMRSLAQVLEQRHTQMRLHWAHIKAHTQHPRNELVDRLAKYAANHPDLVGNCDVWMPWITDGLHQHTLPWLWYYEHLQHQPHDAPRLDGTLMTAHCPPIASEDHHYFDHPDTATHQGDSEVISFDFVMATVNILTLATEDNHGRITPTKQELLMKQFSEAGCHILGLQETRHKRIINPNNEFYHIVGHPCDAKGHDGVQMWFAKNKPLFLDGPYIQMKHLRIVHATPSLLIVKIDMPNWCSIFITGHAPHAGRPVFEGQQFWDQVSKNVRQYSHVMPIFFLGDTNAHLGAQTTQAVGSHHASMENSPGIVFHDWLLEHQLWVPSTFQAHQTGERHSTFNSPDGQHETKIDYVAIPLNIEYTEVHSWIDDTIDLGGARTDHVAALCQCRFEKNGKLRQTQPVKWRTGPTRHAMAAQIRDPASATAFYQQLYNPTWNLDPHQSADHLAWCAHNALQKITPMTHRWKRKHHVDDSTWALVEEKKMLFRQFKAMRKARSNTILQVMFRAWKSQAQDVPHNFDTEPTTWMKMIDHAIATTTTKMQSAAKRASEAIRKADTQYYLSLAEQTGHAYTHEGLTAVWKKIKAVLPRNKLKQTQARQEMSDSLLHHFAELEAGTITNQADSRQSCIDRNNQDLAAGPHSRQLALEDLPTLVEIEDLCLKQRPNRAPGLDAIPPEVCRFAAKEIAPYIHNVILKSFLWGLEPVRYKGGQLCAIWKQKNSRKHASSYRGILLAEVFGKILHSWARQRLLPTLVHRRAPGQIGGLPSQQTTTAIQLLKLHGRQGRHQHMTTAVIFVDLKAAFHHMLREYVFSVRDPLQLHELQRIFDSNEFNIDQLAADLQQACQEKPKDIPEALRLFLHDIHRSTWFQLDPDHDQVVTTDRGTRPGSPLADLGFNLLMSRIMHQLGEGLQLLHDYVQGCDQLGTHIPPISWVDDLAIPLTTTAPHKMIPLIQDVVALLHTTFNAHGMTMNFETGKSEAVVMYRGKGANVCRTALFDAEATPCIVTATNTHILSLKVVAAYRHLGARFTMNADGEAEVTSRIAMARQSYQELKRAIFHNKYIPLKGRMQLYDSLIVARLMYACSVWTDISSSQLQQIEAVIIEHHRQMANKGFWNETHMTDAELRNHLEIPPFRVTWARHRLIYLQHLGKHAATFHKQLLLTEFQQGRGWLCEVVTDLRWIAKLVALPFNIPAEVQEWQNVWDILKDLTHWKSLVKRACRKHILQDRIASDVEQYHNVIVDEMNNAGFTMWTDAPTTDEAPPPRFGCDQSTWFLIRPMHEVLMHIKYMAQCQLWGFLINLAREGRILGLLQGPPCETWTAARHQQSVDSEGRALRGPRPLRSTQELWGLALLSCKELEQIYVGNVLLLKGILLACLVTISGGATFLEHPAMPFQDEISSIWRLGLLCLLHRPPYGPFRRVSAEQWRFGSCGVKPTTFLYSNSNLPRALEVCADASATRPTSHLIGRNSDGTFKTAKAKEYPAQLNRAFAQAIFEAMTRWSMAPGDADAESFGVELARTSASTECGQMFPDYQPCG